MLCNRLLYASHVIAPLKITVVYQMAGSFLLLKGMHTLGRSETGLLAYSPNHLQLIDLKSSCCSFLGFYPHLKRP